MEWHCQICGREIKSGNGLIAHHGYIRPGDGWQSQSCYGARRLPYEVSRDAIPEVIALIEVQLDHALDTLKYWTEFPPREIITFRKRNGKRIQVLLTRTPEFDREYPSTVIEYDKEYSSQIAKFKSEIDTLDHQLRFLNNRLNYWIKTAESEVIDFQL